MDEKPKKKIRSVVRNKRTLKYLALMDEKKDIFFFIEMVHRLTTLGDLLKLSGQISKSKKSYKQAAEWQERVISEEKRLFEKIAE